jgi:ABC-type enterochelin transport system permease subunit
MEYIDAILGHVVPIISEASKSKFGLVSLTALIALAIVLLFLYLTARTRPVLSFVLALVAILLMFGGVVGLVLSVDVRKPAIVYDVDMLQRLQTVGFKIPHLEDTTSTDYELLDGMLQRQPDGTCPSRKSCPRVFMMQAEQDWCGDDGSRSLDGSS